MKINKQSKCFVKLKDVSSASSTPSDSLRVSYFETVYGEPHQLVKAVFHGMVGILVHNSYVVAISVSVKQLTPPPPNQNHFSMAQTCLKGFNS